MNHRNPTQDRALSPARILVVLLVAVAILQVIVLGVVVFGFEINAESAPQTRFTFDDGTLLHITHDAGDTIPESELEVVVGNTSYNGTAMANWSTDGNVSTGDTLAVGPGGEVDTALEDGETVRVVWVGNGPRSTLAATTIDR